MAVVDMHPESPFRKAGLQAGDVVLSINGNVVNGPAEMLYHMSVLGVGSNANLVFVRKGIHHQAAVAMIEAPEEPARAKQKIVIEGPFQGLTVSQINPAVIAEISLPTTATGVVVATVEGISAQIGFRPGDILVRVNNVPIAKVSDVLSAANQRTRLWNITIERDGQQLSMRFKL